MSALESVSVVIAGSNGRFCLGRCLRALAASTEPVFEVIVADGALSAADGEWINSLHPRARLLRLPRGTGTTPAVRAAFAAAAGSHIALLASHAVVGPEWPRPLLAALVGDGAIAATCSTLVWNDDPAVVCADGGRLTWLGIGFDEAQGAPLSAADGRLPAFGEASFPTSAALAMARRDWDSCGGYDPAFAAGGADVDLGWRLWLLGRRVVVCRQSPVRADGSQPDAGVRPHGWANAALLRQTLRMLVKHYPPRFLLHALRWTVASRLRSLALPPLAAAIAWNLVHLPGTLRRRRWVQRRRQAAHEALFAGGLLLELHEPPRPAVRTAGTVATDPADWIPSEVLLPGEDSALGRLGAGWNRVESLAGEPVRWTRGAARCALRVAPGAAGRLAATVRLPDGADSPASVTISCNGESATFPCEPGGWRRVEVPARPSAAGLLRIELHVETPADRGRRPGCAVREIRFAPDVAADRSLPSTISVIIPTFNRWPILAETLGALGRQTMREFDVIVVDDGSTDGTWEALEAWQREHPGVAVKAIRQPNLKPGRARNRGLREATGDLVLFLGDDIIPEPDLLAQHLTKHRAVGETIGVLGFTDWDRTRMRVTPFLEFVNSDGAQFAYGHFRDGRDIYFTGFYTSNISLPRWVLGEEPFHPAFTFVDWEDIELGYRLSLRGLRLIYHAAARATHCHPTGIREFHRRQEHVGRTIGVILGLHPELAGNPAMPPLEPRAWYRWARRAAPALLPTLDRWDRRGGRCPRWLYRNLLLCAFWTGRSEAAAAHPPVNA